MTIGHRRTMLLLVLILAIPELCSAVRRGRLIGKVVDPEGNPIQGVAVTATSNEIPSFKVEAMTDKKGVFKVDFDQLNVVYHYRFEKVGHRTTEANQSWSLEGTANHDFTMHPADTAPPTVTSAPPASTSNAAILAFNDGLTAFRAKDYPVAQAKLEQAVEHDGGLRVAWEVLSAVRVELTQYQEAVQAADEAIALGSTDALPLRARFEAYRKLGDEMKAAEAKEALERTGRLTDEANRIHNQGVTLLKADDPAGAFAKFQEALEVDPNHEPALLGVATTGIKIGRDADTKSAAEALLAIDPQNAEALRLRYNASLKLGDEEAIVEALVGLAQIEPEIATDSLFRLAEGAFEYDDFAKARKRLEVLLSLAPDHPRSNYLMGIIFMREGASKSARKHIERFLQLAPDDPDAATAAQLLAHL